MKTWSKKISFALAGVMAASIFGAAAGVKAAEVTADTDAIVSVQSITDTLLVGQKLKAVAIEYKGEVDPVSIRTRTYSIQGLKGDNKTMADAVITAVYTNDSPEMREDKTSVPGNYVIAEIDEEDGVGTLVLDTWYYTDPNGEEQKTTYGRLDEVVPVVYQIQDVVLDGGAVLAKANKEEPVAEEKFLETININFDDFEDLVLDSENNTYGDAKIRVKYHLPENYDETKKYPLVVVQCGGGPRLKEIETKEGMYSNYGANIAFDQSVTAWMSADYAYEDVILVSVAYRGMQDVTEGEERYVAADDINQAAEYFADNYSVDRDRIIYSGNSQGSLKGYQVVSRNNDFWTAFMPCNGVSVERVDDPYENDANMEAFMELVKGVMDPMIEAHIAVMWNMGEADWMAPDEWGILYYNYYKEALQAEGMSDEEIDSLIQFHVFDDNEFLGMGLVNADGSANGHSTTKLVYNKYTDMFQPWLLGQKKSENMAK